MAVELVTKDEFDAKINEDKVTLVDFFAEWCGPCKSLAPILDELAGEMGDGFAILKVDVDSQPELAQQHNVMSIPNVLIFKNGSQVDSFVGVKTKEEIKEILEKASQK